MLQKATWLFWVLYFSGHYAAFAQTNACNFTLKGRVIDSSAKIALSAALLTNGDFSKKIATNAEGNFKITESCGQLTLLCQCNGYLPSSIELNISKDTNIIIALVPLSHTTAEVEILNKTIQVHSFSSSQTLSGASLEATRGQSLGDALITIPGLNVLQTGPTLSKPMIRGMTGNRIVILNNGVRQEGQQWGSEHAPEIDPFSANSLTVIKGAQALQYGSDALGGVILVEPASLPYYTKTQGFVATYGASNNRLIGTAVQVEGGMPLVSGLAWRAQISTKKAGDVQTAKYIMRNTGVQELNGNAALGFKKGAFHTEIYYSYYSTRIGIFKYSHIGSVSDLIRAINNPDTVYKDSYSSSIERPYQQISHHLLKSKTSYKHPKWGKMSAIASYQLDYRDEYDTHLRLKLTNPDAPELSFKLRTFQYDVLWEPVSKSTRQSKIGVIYGTQSNVSAGRQLIPNFRNYTAAAYLTEKWTTEKWLVEGAIRYDYRYLVAYQIVDGNYRKPSYHFSNVSTSIGASRLFANSELKISIASTLRAPQVSELFSNGIHHGTASYELGDSTLRAERCYNSSLTYSFVAVDSKLSGEISTYLNYIQDYIYLQPLYPDSRLTISSTFPLFQYKQADVLFRGVDGFARYQFLPQWAVNSKASVVRTWNFAINDFLIFTPADRYHLGLEYKYISPKKWAISINPELVKVLFQNRTPANTDFSAAPNGYILLNTSIQLQVPFRNSAMYFTLSGYNLLNEAYREYLNRMRYYSLDMGRNVMLQVKIPF